MAMNAKSPCSSQCSLDPSDFCMGCDRSLADIVGWSAMGAQGGEAAWARACARRAWRAKDGRVRAIMALGPAGEAGRGDDLPWRLPSELAWFKRATWGSALALGRPTWEALPGSLPGRDVAVLGSREPRRMERLGDRGLWAKSLPEAKAWADARGANLCLGGGPALWGSGWESVELAWITRVQGPMEADAFFEPDLSGFSLVAEGPSGGDGDWAWSASLWERPAR